MLGVDRLDMIKGIPQKILAFEKFLEENASWRDKVVLLQIAVPTRTDVSECKLFLIFFDSVLAWQLFKMNLCGCNLSFLLQIKNSQAKFMRLLDALMVVLGH